MRGHEGLNMEFGKNNANLDLQEPNYAGFF